jgi:hypothetical protein
MTTRDPDANLTDEQRILYARIQKANDLLRQAKETAEERARQRIRDELAELEALRNHQVREAHALYEATKFDTLKRGLPTASIKRAMRTKDHLTVTRIWEDIDLTTYETPAEQPSFSIDYTTMTGTVHWIDWNGERVEGNVLFTVTRDEEEFDGIRWWPSYGAEPQDGPLVDALDDNDTFMALARQVDAAVRAERGEK